MHGKKLSWRRDPNTLERLAKVQRLWLMNYSTRQIEQAIGIDHSTAARDIKRVQALINENVTRELIKAQNESIAKYRETQNMAYLAFLQAAGNSPNKSRYLDTVKACEDSIVKILGLTAPIKVQIEHDLRLLAEANGLNPDDVLKEAGMILQEGHRGHR